MKYNYRIDVRENNDLRANFNILTREIFGFDFIDWYEKGYWSDKYIPHILADNNGKVISNVSVNLMKFDVGGVIKNYIQLGTIMTDSDYRGQGLNKFILEKVLEEYSGKVDGIYLFGNDSVLNYYPKFGFKATTEYKYSLKLNKETQTVDEKQKGYFLKKVDMADNNSREKLFRLIKKFDDVNMGHNPNDGFSMCANLGLYQFWLTSEFEESVYYLPEMDAYVIADREASADLQTGILSVYQIISNQPLDMGKLALSFAEISEIKLLFTPINKELYDFSLHKVEDCTSFILGDDLERISLERLMFPVISHA